MQKWPRYRQGLCPKFTNPYTIRICEFWYTAYTPHKTKNMTFLILSHFWVNAHYFSSRFSQVTRQTKWISHLSTWNHAPESSLKSSPYAVPVPTAVSKPWCAGTRTWPRQHHAEKRRPTPWRPPHGYHSHAQRSSARSLRTGLAASPLGLLNVTLIIFTLLIKSSKAKIFLWVWKYLKTH